MKILMSLRLPSVLAALCTPIDDQGRPDYAAFDRVVDFVMDRGVEGIVLGGATAEFPHFSVDQRAALIGRAVHRMAGRGPVLIEGMALAIEPMLVLGRPATVLLDDGWTVVSADGSWSAHFEHTVAITAAGPQILTAL